MNGYGQLFEKIDAVIGPVYDAYVACAVWADARDENGEPLTSTGIPEFERRSAQLMLESVTEALMTVLTDDAPTGTWEAIEANPERFGHDLWLTRQRHGAGFWDGGYWAEPCATWLTDMAHAMGEQGDIILADDGRLQLS